MSNGFIHRMDEGIFFKPKGDIQLFLAFTSKVNSYSSDGDGFLGLG